MRLEYQMLLKSPSLT